MNILFFSVSSTPLNYQSSQHRLAFGSKPFLEYSEDIAVVEREIRPSYKGRVRYRGLSWLAQCERYIAFQPGDRVLVVSRRNITLIVVPIADEENEL